MTKNDNFEKKPLIATVDSIKGKTAKLLLKRITEHPKYRKKITKFSRISAHYDLENADSLRKGDTVMIVESRPLSKTKRWIIKKSL